MKTRIISLALALVLLIGSLSGCSSCGGDKTEKPDALVIMTDNLDGLFNPYFSTSASDGTIVGMTQIGMLSSTYENGEVKVAFGEDEAVVTKDFHYGQNAQGDTVYTFVLKNGIKFSDGHPLTMEDVLFNLYVYLDPVYTGSATMYSTDIKGLAAYRLQNPDATSDSDENDNNETYAANAAEDRIMELVQLFWDAGKGVGSSYDAPYSTMKEAILNHTLSDGYLSAVATEDEKANVTSNQLLEDYENALERFKTELYNDYESAKDAFTEEPYKGHSEFENPNFCFLFYEGLVAVEYEKKPGTNEDDKSKIKKMTPNVDLSMYSTKDAIIERVYSDFIRSQLDMVLLYTVTAQELRTQYTAKAKEVILHDQLDGNELVVKNISGIVSLGHNAATKGTTITVNGNNYTVASNHDENGVPTDGYDVLQITINGIDPKAHWNFAFTVAPQHYYGEGSKVGVDIENNKFGVEWSSFEFMKEVVQSVRNIKLPMGAGPYKVTDRSNSDAPEANGFYSDNVVYFKANNNFETVGEGINNAKIEKIRYQVVSSSNALGALQEGSVHYVTPQLTSDNFDKIQAMAADGMKYLMTDMLGYGYIGINASKVEDINLRRAIMCAMNTTLALDYYRSGTADQIYYPMSTVSWAYPEDTSGNLVVDNGRDYPQINKQFSPDVAITNIQKYMQAAGVSAGHSDLKIKFTIAGSNLQDHPTYKTFRDAAALLNSLGWDITVEADTQALTKINTGALAVWAAAWGSSIDPDMYQIYHKNSTATSTLGWGYNAIKASGSDEEIRLLNELSDLIDDARETDVQSVRADLYKQAMEKVLDLAIELPVYQRSTLYVYNSNVINSDTLPTELNPYSSPLDRIWEIELVD